MMFATFPSAPRRRRPSRTRKNPSFEQGLHYWCGHRLATTYGCDGDDRPGPGTAGRRHEVRPAHDGRPRRRLPSSTRRSTAPPASRSPASPASTDGETAASCPASTTRARRDRRQPGVRGRQLPHGRHGRGRVDVRPHDQREPHDSRRGSERRVDDIVDSTLDMDAPLISQDHVSKQRTGEENMRLAARRFAGGLCARRPSCSRFPPARSRRRRPSRTRRTRASSRASTHWTITVPPPPTDATATIVPGQVRQGGGTKYARPHERTVQEAAP